MIAEEKTAFIRILLRCCAKNRRMVSVLFLLSGEGRGDKLVIPASISELQELYNEWQNSYYQRWLAISKFRSVYFRSNRSLR